MDKFEPGAFKVTIKGKEITGFARNVNSKKELANQIKLAIKRMRRGADVI